MKHLAVFQVLAILAGLLVPPALTYAQEPPPLPHSFFGNLTILGNAAPVNTLVEAKIYGIVRGSFISTVPGRYGSSNLLESQLVVQADVPDSTTIHFYINGADTGETYSFHSGYLTQLNLNVGGTISGQVFQSDGITPIAGALIEASGLTSRSTRTFDDGTYTIYDLMPGTYQLTASAQGFLIEYYDGVANRDEAKPVSVSGTEAITGVDFSLDRGGSISGCVYQSDGTTPIPGVNIVIKDYSTGRTFQAMTQEEGNYSVSGLTPGSYTVYAESNDFLREYYSEASSQDSAVPVVVVGENETGGINFTLSAAGSISGSVFEEDGVTPIFEAYIRAKSAAGYTATYATYDGSYTIEGLLPGSYIVYAEAPGRYREYYQETASENGASVINIGISDTVQGVDFTLVQGGTGTISGHVYQADGITPVLNATINISPTGQGFFADGGQYTIYIPPGTYTLHAYAPGYLIEYYPAPITVTAASEISGIDFVMEVGGSISGRVTRADGTPITSGGLYAKHLANNDTYYASISADGSYTITALPSGSYRVYAQSDYFLREYYGGVYDESQATLVDVTAPSNTPDINFTLHQGGTISGCVYAADGITPLAGISVSASVFDSGYATTSSITAADGSYTLSGLYPGEYRVAAKSNEYITEYYSDVPVPYSATPVTVSAETDTSGIDFTLERGGSISGNVYSSDGITPIVWANVSVKDYDTGDSVASATTVSGGSYTVRGLNAGTYRVQVSANRYITEFYHERASRIDADPVVVVLGEDTAGIDFTLQLGGSISGHVYKSDGVTPLANVRVGVIETNQGYQAIPPEENGLASEPSPAPAPVPVPAPAPAPKPPPYSYSAYTAADGSYTVTGLYSGNYKVSAFLAGYVTEYYANGYYSYQAEPVSVALAAETDNIDFTIGQGSTVSGHVYESDGSTPIRTARVYIESQGNSYSPFSAYVYVAYDGSYTIGGVPAGKYIIYATASNHWTEYYSDASKDSATLIDVTPGSAVSGIDFTLDLSGSISGHVYRADGVTPIPDASVYAVSVETGTGGAPAYPAPPFSLVTPTYPLPYPSPAPAPAPAPDHRTASDGSYRLTGLLPGDYIVYAYSSGYVREYYLGVPISDDATPVSVIAGADTSGIDFTLEPGGFVSGHVYQADGVTPVSGAQIYAIDYVSRANAQARSGEDGGYTLNGLYPGSYTLSCAASDYPGEYYENATSVDDATLIDIEVISNITGIDFTLEPGGCIAGHIFQSDGVTPVSYGTVYAILNGFVSRYVSISDDGSYRIPGLPSGVYKVKTSAYEYIPEFYDGVYEEVGATEVIVNVPDTTSDIDFTLEQRGAISGHVYHSDGTTPLKGCRILLNTTIDTDEKLPLAPGVYIGGTSVTASTDQTGSYICDNLLPGSYLLCIAEEGYITEYYGGVRYRESATLVTVNTAEITRNIDFVLDRGGAISGHVYQSDGTPTTSGSVIVNTISESMSEAETYLSSYVSKSRLTSVYSDIYRTVGVRPDGTYQITGLPTGQYIVKAWEGNSLVDYYNNADFVTLATTVSVTAPEETTGIDFIFKSGGSISGRISRTDGTPIPQAAVFALSPDGTFCARATTDSQGFYSIVRLPTGEFYVMASHWQYYSYKYYGNTHSLNDATLVGVISPGDTQGIDLILDEGGSISGVVYESDGATPVSSKAWVHAETLDSVYGMGAYTDSNGSYIIKGLIEGNYRVKVEATGLQTEYYGGTQSAAEAVTVNVSATGESTGIDFTLGPDNVPPEVISISPIASVEIDPVNAVIRVEFNEAMNKMAVQSAFSVSPAVIGVFSWQDNSMTYTPVIPLAGVSNYLVNITRAARDSAGNALNQEYSWSFTTTLRLIPGDANDDGVRNALDITKLERIIAGLDTRTSGADANQDGVINALDITKLERIIAGLD